MFTSKLHKQWTSLDNQQILEDIRRFLIGILTAKCELSSCVPGINMNLTELLTIACLWQILTVRTVRITTVPPLWYARLPSIGLSIRWRHASVFTQRNVCIADQLARTVPHLPVTALTKHLLLNPSFILWIRKDTH